MMSSDFEFPRQYFPIKRASTKGRTTKADGACMGKRQTLAVVWTANTWSKRRWHTNNLQWILAAVPVLKTLVLGFSFVFWYSCLTFSTCSFWLAFGVFVSRIFFETACFATFLLIAHGYCIMREHLSLSDRNSIAGLASLLYLLLTGYKADIPQFVVLVALMYMLLMYVIFVRISQNLLILKEQLQYMHNEGVLMMQTAICVKYNMLKKFQRAMYVIMASQILIHCRPDGVASHYWMWLMVREWTEIGILFYIGWTFRSREMTPFFTVIPTCRSLGQHKLPQIFSVDMNVNDFNSLNFKELHVGVPTSLSKGRDVAWPMLVIVQNPGTSISANLKTICSESAQLQTINQDGSLPVSHYEQL
ncbi:unnamed protein product [Calypogeia fissa]